MYPRSRKGGREKGRSGTSGAIMGFPHTYPGRKFGDPAIRTSGGELVPFEKKEGIPQHPIGKGRGKRMTVREENKRDTMYRGGQCEG